MSAPRPPRVNGLSASNGNHGAPFLVPYGHESSEESDQEGGALENGLAKPHFNGRNGGTVYGPAPRPQPAVKTNGAGGSEAGLHHNSNGISKPSQNGHQNGHHKVNGLKHPDKVISQMTCQNDKTE